MSSSQPPPYAPPPAGGPALYPPPEQSPGRSNLLILVVVGLAVACLSCSILALAGLAGYNDGVRTLDRIARATRQADIAHQYDLAVTDIAVGNRELALLRLEHVVLTLGAQSADAEALLTRVNAVTATPTPSPTFTPSPTPLNTATPTPSPTAGMALPAPDTLFAEAQAAFTVRNYATTIEKLNILRGLAPNFRRADVEPMLHESLVTLSRQYLLEASGNRLAEGIVLAEQARAIAPIGDLAYEAYVAGRYLDGLNAEGMECLLAVREWESIYSEVPAYRDVSNRLANAYAACGDAWTYQTEYCPAEQYYRWSLSIIRNSSVAARLQEAADQCANATPTPTPTEEGAPAEEMPPPSEGGAESG